MGRHTSRRSNTCGIPKTQSLWVDFDPERFSDADREAGALVWSHRAWVEYSAIAESEAVLVRSCIESGINVDFKYCLSMRAVERARSTDLAHILADTPRDLPPLPVRARTSKDSSTTTSFAAPCTPTLISMATSLRT